jgi:signal transduction histidine kinase
MVSAICRDDYGHLWIANSNGLLEYSNGFYRVFDNNDGLPSKTIPYRTLKKDANNQLWFGTLSGLGKGELSNVSLVSPEPVITSFKLSGKISSFDRNSRFLNTQILSFKIAAPAYPARHVKYKYRISDGDDGEWLDVRPGEYELVLSGLDVGDYKLSLKACNIGFYEWSTAKEYDFSVYKIWYQRTWVLVGFYLLILFVVGFYVFYSRWKNERERIKLEIIIDERTRSLKERNEELNSMNEELNEANKKAQQAVETKDKFFSIVAHDLKSPFNALIGISDLLSNQSGKIPEETKVRLLKEMHETSENTYKLLHNLLSWARSQTGNIEVHRDFLIVSDVVEEVIESVESNAKQKNIEILMDVEEDLDLSSDSFMLSTVIRNLVSNAIKFSNPNSQIEIICVGTKDEFRLVVKDYGVGIDPERISGLFSLGGSRSTSGTKNEKGTGLGLLLSYEFVTKLGGTLSVNSILNEGTSFEILLPLEKG